MLYKVLLFHKLRYVGKHKDIKNQIYGIVAVRHFPCTSIHSFYTDTLWGPLSTCEFLGEL